MLVGLSDEETASEWAIDTYRVSSARPVALTRALYPIYESPNEDHDAVEHFPAGSRVSKEQMLVFCQALKGVRTLFALRQQGDLSDSESYRLDLKP